MITANSPVRKFVFAMAGGSAANSSRPQNERGSLPQHLDPRHFRQIAVMDRPPYGVPIESNHEIHLRGGIGERAFPQPLRIGRLYPCSMAALRNRAPQRNS